MSLLHRFNTLIVSGSEYPVFVDQQLPPPPRSDSTTAAATVSTTAEAEVTEEAIVEPLSLMHNSGSSDRPTTAVATVYRFFTLSFAAAITVICHNIGKIQLIRHLGDDRCQSSAKVSKASVLAANVSSEVSVMV